jgi:hypothetical protein
LINYNPSCMSVRYSTPRVHYPQLNPSRVCLPTNFQKFKCHIPRNISDFYVNLRVEVAAVSRNRFGVEKTVDTHKILLNAIKILCLSSRNMIDKTMCEVLWRNISDFYVNLRVEVGKHPQVNLAMYFFYLGQE